MEWLLMLSITNKMQWNTIIFIAVNALHVSGGFPAHHQELKNCTYSIWYLSSLIAATASVVEMELHGVPSQRRIIYTGCPRRNVSDFGRMFLMLKYTDITQNTYIQS